MLIHICIQHDIYGLNCIQFYVIESMSHNLDINYFTYLMLKNHMKEVM